MKKLSLLFSFLLFTAIAFAQINVTISGTISDTAGDGVGDITVNVSVDSTNTNFVYFNTVLTDADGNYTDTFEVPADMTQGAVFVWIQNCDGSYLSQVAYWSPGSNPVVDFVYCNVDCSVTVTEPSPGTLSANAQGVAPFIYLWSNNSTQSVITVSQTGTYCVTIIDNNGCESTSCYYFNAGGNNDTLCYVAIEVDSSNIGFTLTGSTSGTAPITYMWSTGENTQSIEVTGEGEYCLSVSDAANCTASTCYDFGNGCNAAVYIVEGNASLFANASGAQPFTYAWNTGESTQSITPNTNGEYCVTIVDNEGCEAYDCHYYSVFIDSCYVSIEVAQNGAWLQANPSGAAPFAYLWSTNEITSSIEMTEEIEYCLSVTDATGCVAVACYDNSPVPFNVFGYVFPLDSINIQDVEGIVDLYRIEGDEVNFVATTEIDQNSYYFGDVAEGEYLTQAIVEDNVPTYHQNSEWWDEADVISSETPVWWGYNIQLIPLDEFNDNGPGIINGGVFDGDGLVSHEVDDRNDDPIEGAEILLFNNDGAPIDYVFTNAEGSFSFGNLPYGTYTVYIEIPGFEQVFYTVTISPNNETVDNINFEVGQNTITTGNREILLESTALSVYPNPVKNELNVNFDSNISRNATIQIVNSLGQVVMSDNFEQNKTFNLAKLNSGVFLVKITTQAGIAVQQFIKE